MGTMTCTCYQKTNYAYIQDALHMLNMVKDFGDPNPIQRGYRMPYKAADRRYFRDRKAENSQPVGQRFRPSDHKVKNILTLHARTNIAMHDFRPLFNSPRKTPKKSPNYYAILG